MINIKGGTQTWSKAAQQSSLEVDKTKTMAAGSEAKVLGEKDLGTYLNEIADPNWVDPKKMRRVGNDQLDKDAFLKLFLAQLKNQDPTNPMESHDLAAQLAQFTQLEKLNNIDKGITTLAKPKEQSTNYDSLNLIGKTVSGDTSKIFRTDSAESHDIGFELKQDAATAEVKIKNAYGEVVKTLSLKGLKAGKNEVNWNGVDGNGRKMPDGQFFVEIEAKGSNGRKVFADTKFEGKITGVNYTAAGPVLMMGKKTVRMQDVKKIFQPEPQAPAANVNRLNAVGEGNKAQATVKPQEGQKAAPQAQGNLSQVGMSRGLMNNLEKQGQDIKGVN